MRIAFVGPPGIGKGTHVKRLAKETGRPHISTGDIFRLAIKDGCEIGQYVKTFLETGRLVPCELVIKVVMERISQDDCKGGYYLDGFPRTLHQAEFFDKSLSKVQMNLDCVLEFYAQEEEKELIGRILGRRFCTRCPEWFHVVNKAPKEEMVCDSCSAPLYQRFDDTAETFKKRLKLYKDLSRSLLPFYEKKGILRRLNTGAGIEETYKVLLGLIG
jgi:adenylate kinase